MNNQSWQLTQPLDAVIFDCDGTLSHLEGINELAMSNGVGPKVAKLTEQAMCTHGLSAELYQQRMQLVKPNRQQLQQLGQDYFYERSPHSLEIIQLLQSLNKTVFILSAGLNPAVKLFGELLGITDDHIYAVDVYFDERGQFRAYDKQNPLTDCGGKPIVVEKLKQQYPRLLHIGDGMNDYELHEDVTRFVGYGGVEYRKSIAEKCHYYIRSASLAALLPLCLVAEELDALTAQQRELYYQGIADIEQQRVDIR